MTGRWGIFYILGSVASRLDLNEYDLPQSGCDNIDLVMTCAVIACLYSISMQTEIVRGVSLAKHSNRVAFGITLPHLCQENG